MRILKKNTKHPNLNRFGFLPMMTENKVNVKAHTRKFPKKKLTPSKFDKWWNEKGDSSDREMIVMRHGDRVTPTGEIVVVKNDESFIDNTHDKRTCPACHKYTDILRERFENDDGCC